MGGGSASGTIEWSGYLQGHHKWGLGHIEDIIKDMWNNQPRRFLYNPKPLFGESSHTALGLMDEFVDGDVDGIYSSMIADSKSLPVEFVAWKKRTTDSYNDWKAESGDDYVEAMVGAHKRRMLDDLDTNVLPRFKVGSRDIGAVHTDGFVIGKALLLKEYQRSLAEVDARLHQQEHRDRQAQRHRLAMGGLGQTQTEVALRKLQHEVAFRRTAMVMQQKETSAKLADGILADAAGFAMKHAGIQTETVLREHVRKAEAMRYWMESMASISGGIPLRPGEEMSTTRAVIGGALGGFAQGYSQGGMSGGWAGLAAGVAGGLLS